MKKGISLVALVITIIVLIIITGTVVLNIGGENSIINKAKEANEMHRASLVEEKAIEWKMNVKTLRLTGIGTEKTLEIELDELKAQRLLTEEEVTEIINSPNKEITIATKTISFLLEGETTEEQGQINFSRFTEPHEGQSQENLNIGIGTDGELVNLDLWSYRRDIDIDGVLLDGYQGEIENGEIQGTVPAFIKFDGEEEFISVTSMRYIFSGCTSLVTAPTIPNSVTNMSGTFEDCTSLVTAPTIPNGVTEMGCTFIGCTSLVTAPIIPNGVENMGSTFQGCTSLVTIPTIPSSVINMVAAFADCTSLVTAPIIPNGVEDMGSTFNGCTSLVTAPTIPSSVTDIAYTFRGCTSLATVPIIPNNVTDMKYTFYGCISLSGNIQINTNRLERYGNCFTQASTHQGTNLVLVGNGTNGNILQYLLSTKSNNSNISIQ